MEQLQPVRNDVNYEEQACIRVIPRPWGTQIRGKVQETEAALYRPLMLSTVLSFLPLLLHS